MIAPPLLAPPLLGWYDRHRRTLPWRAPPGGIADPYRVWLSEIMLQQTTVAAVDGYFRRFVARWPDFAALAAADLDAVLREWAGLGYYARARNLHRCAQAVVERFGGRLPADEAALLGLPGIGAYTAAAIAAIAFDLPANVVDGNVERVLARVFAVTAPLPGVRPRLRALGAAAVPDRRAGDYAQALMDLGATVCRPRAPACAICPLMTDCRARAAGLAESLPARAAKADKPTRRGLAFWITDPAGAVLLRRRPERGLLGGMIEVPSTAWVVADSVPAVADAVGEAPLAAECWHRLPGVVRHTFTHFHLELGMIAATVPAGPPPPGCRWVAPGAVAAEALPSVMRKLVRHALAAAADGAAG